MMPLVHLFPFWLQQNTYCASQLCWICKCVCFVFLLFCISSYFFFSLSFFSFSYSSLCNMFMWICGGQKTVLASTFCWCDTIYALRRTEHRFACNTLHDMTWATFKAPIHFIISVCFVYLLQFFYSSFKRMEEQTSGGRSVREWKSGCENEKENY